MKELSELNLPTENRYAETHEWIRVDGDEVVVGISDYAQDQLGDIVYVELPRVGATLARGEEFGTVESVKAVSDLVMPVAGEVTTVNANLENDPGLVNSAPYTDGWMIRIKPDDPAAADSLLSSDDYLAKLQG